MLSPYDIFGLTLLASTTGKFATPWHSGKFDEVSALESNLRSAAVNLHGYSERVQFAAGRVQMVQGFVRSVMHRANSGEERAKLIDTSSQTTANDYELDVRLSMGNDATAEHAIIFHQNLEIQRLTKERAFL